MERAQRSIGARSAPRSQHLRDRRGNESTDWPPIYFEPTAGAERTARR